MATTHKDKQITVRVSEDLLEFLDHQVALEHLASRAELVVRALLHEQQRIEREREVAILKQWKDRDPDQLEQLAGHVSATPLDID